MRRTVLGLAAAAFLVLAACGGDDDDNSSTDDEASQTTEALDAEGGEASPSSPEAARFCEQFTELTQQGPEATDPETIIESMRSLEAPDEIADDLALTIEGAELQAQMTAGGAEPDPELMADFQERSEEFAEANNQIQQYVSTECGLGGPPPEGGVDPEAMPESEG